MTSGDVDTIVQGLVANAQKTLATMDSNKSFLGSVFGSNGDILASQGSVAQLLLTPDGSNWNFDISAWTKTAYTAQLLTIYRIQQDGYAAAGDADDEASWVGVTQNIADQINYGPVAVQFSTASAIVNSTVDATKQDLEAAAKNAVPTLKLGLGAIIAGAVAVVCVIAYLEGKQLGLTK